MDGVVPEHWSLRVGINGGFVLCRVLAIGVGEMVPGRVHPSVPPRVWCQQPQELETPVVRIAPILVVIHVLHTATISVTEKSIFKNTVTFPDRYVYLFRLQFSTPMFQN